MSSPQTIEIRELDPEIIPPHTKNISNQNYHGGSKIVVIGKPGCFAPGTKVIMFDGTLQNVEHICVGDKIMGDDSTVRNVIELCHNYDDMFKIIPDNGQESYIVNKLHKLVILYNNKIKEITVQNYINKSTKWKNNTYIYKTHINFPYKRTELDPYTLGVQLAGSMTDKGLYSKQHIPHDYKCNSTIVRLQLLAGILDADGIYNLNNNTCEFIQANENFIDDITFLARSLGYSVIKNPYVKSCIYNKKVFTGKYHQLVISGDLDKIPCRVLKNICNMTKNKDYSLTTKFKVEKIGCGEYYGFTLDNNHRFLLSTFDVVRNTGKSTIIKGLLYAKKHIFPVGIAMSGTEDTNHNFSAFMPDSFIYNDYDEKKIQDFIKRQKIASEHLPNPWAVLILDDCTDDPRIFNKPLQNSLYKKGRNWKMLYILSLQFAMDIKPNIRTNIDGTFILREPLESNREKIYRNYASIIPSYELFSDIMDQLTEDYHALYIHNATTSNIWQECVFYWKAPIPPKDWKFGSEDYWNFHHARYNPNYTEPLY